MRLSRRSLISLHQLLTEVSPNNAASLIIKYDIADEYAADALLRDAPRLREELLSINPEVTGRLLGEIAQTSQTLRRHVTPYYRFDERWNDLQRHLLLDGYRLAEGRITSIEPQIEGAVPIEDELTSEMTDSNLNCGAQILSEIKLSAQHFSASDYGGCLSHMRIALETLVREIAETRRGTERFDSEKWGQTLAHLRIVGIITRKQEEGISGAYSFICDGCHRPLGIEEVEYARLGRSLVLHMCYFLVKLHKANSPTA